MQVIFKILIQNFILNLNSHNSLYLCYFTQYVLTFNIPKHTFLFPLQRLFEIHLSDIKFPLKYSVALKLSLTSSKGRGRKEESIC
jgi:hypothetical protein